MNRLPEDCSYRAITSGGAYCYHVKGSGYCYEDCCPLIVITEQPKEYIISELQLEIIERVSVDGYSNVFRHVRSHPYIPEQSKIDTAIKELEKEKLKVYKEITNEFLEQDTYREGIIWACNKAIALLRGEDGK